MKWNSAQIFINELQFYDNLQLSSSCQPAIRWIKILTNQLKFADRVSNLKFFSLFYQIFIYFNSYCGLFIKILWLFTCDNGSFVFKIQSLRRKTHRPYVRIEDNRPGELNNSDIIPVCSPIVIAVLLDRGNLKVLMTSLVVHIQIIFTQTNCQRR